MRGRAPERRGGRRGRRRERGSTIVYALVIMGSVALLVAANLDLAGGVRRSVQRDEEDLRSRYALGAASETVTALASASSAYAGGTFTMTCGGRAYTVVGAPTADTHGATISVTGPDGRAMSTTGSNPATATYAEYGLFVDSTSDINDDLVVGSAAAPNHVYFGKTPNQKKAGQALLNVYGAVDTAASASSFQDFAPDRTGPISTGVEGGKLPNLNGAALALAANSTVGKTTLAGLDFGLYARTGGRVPLVYGTGDLTLTGLWRGRGTVYAAGNVTIKPPLATVGASSELVILTNGSVTIDGDGGVQAFVYCGTKAQVAKKSTSVVLTGALWTSSLQIEQPITLFYDDEFWARPASLDEFYLPAATQ